MMFAFREPQGLREFEFFQLLLKVNKWELKGDKFIMHAVNDKNEKVSMIFTETK